MAAVGAAGGTLILQAVRLAARWPTCCLLAHGRPMGPTGVNGLAAGDRPAYWAQSGNLAEEKQIWYLKLGAILNTIQSSLLTTYTSRIHTDTPTPSGLRNGPTYVALALWLSGPPCKWSGVEWTADRKSPQSETGSSMTTNYDSTTDCHRTYLQIRAGGGVVSPFISTKRRHRQQIDSSSVFSIPYRNRK